ncbi:uncharacterized protein CheB98a [Drosophila kikkawai]|uniref:Uncharacterized protein CheB98a n=1 Tax=Drosophila kikkawai TaxID=30033 RepID=A0A6P4IQQ3_DROKI|nr:uncharacterized protein LOC108080886 [Drosophila kikkawai]
MILKVTLLLATLSLVRAKDATYELILSDSALIAACKEPAPGRLNIDGFMDLSEISTTLNEHGVVLAGNVTFVWGIQPQDRIKAVIKLLYLDRGTWTPTFYTVTSNDYCKSMYDSRLPWHTYWLRHVTNYEDVKDKCISPGTKLILETYLLSLAMTLPKLREGFYKVQLTYQAFDANGTERPTNICFEILGDLQKV